MGTRTAHRASSSSSSFSSSKQHWMYDVFLSFRGEDTRNNFTGHLYMALREAGINAFFHDNELRRGEYITAKLVTAIQGSRISVIVFSRRYAKSSWCLDELVKIMESRTTLGQTVMPIFYDIDPSDVREQRGSFAQAFEKHEENLLLGRENKVVRWRAALIEAANLSGWDLRNAADGYEAKFIREIIEGITRWLLMNETISSVVDYAVGLNSRVQDLSNYLDVGSDDVRIVGILGMGGIGKTTLARAIYNQFYHSFEGKSLLLNVRETAKKPNGLKRMQEQILSDILKPTKIGRVDINVLKTRLRCRRVLIIIDDVDHKDQLNALATYRDSFGPGSRIIITTRDKHLLELFQVDKIYHAQEMNEEEALELFSWHAFKNNRPNAGYFKLSKCVVAYCGGLPLALEVLGSFLFRRSTREWKSTLDKLRKIPAGDIQKQLKISFDGLSDDKERDIFLDISCFFIGMNRNYVTQILDGCGFFPEIGLSVLIERCLITVSEENKLMMHDLLRDMGREIVYEESLNDPRNCSRLWHPEDVTDVLKNESGTEEIQGVTLNLIRSEKATFSTHAFTNMKKLRLLKLNYVELTGEYKYLSRKLRWLCWHGFPLKIIPNDFDQQNLVAMDLRYSNLRHFWKDDEQLLEKLKILNLSHSYHLLESPNFSKLPNLETLILKGCKSLSKVHQSIGHLERLASVNFKDCRVLKDLPRSFYESKSIETLILVGCWEFENLAEDLGDMVSLTTILADNTAIRKIPSSIVRLKNLKYLSLCSLRWRSPSNCLPCPFWSLQLPRPYRKSNNLFPPSLRGLYSLRELHLRSCYLFHDAPADLESLKSLEELDLGCNSFHSPPYFSGLSKLEHLSLDNCNFTNEEIDSMNIGSLTSLLALNLEGNSFHCLPDLSSLSKLDCLILNDCTNLREMPKLPTSLTQLVADDCTALQTMPNFSEMLNIDTLHLSHSHKLIEFPGLDTALNSMRLIRMEGCTNISSTVKKNLLQGWNSSGGGGLYLPGNDIPEWFTYVNEGDEVSFEVPQVSGCNLKALTVCTVYKCLQEEKSKLYISIFVTNHSNCTSFLVQPTYPYTTISHEVIWQGHLSNKDFNLEGGDFIEVCVAFGSGHTVKKIGVSLLWDKFIYDTDSFIACKSVPYAYSLRDDEDDDEEYDEDDNDDYYKDDDDEEEEEDDDDDDDDGDEDDDEDGDDDHEPEIKFSGLYDDEAGPSLRSSDLNIEMRRMNMEES
ncbi:unnamed protein product [Prunus armeniaca]